MILKSWIEPWVTKFSSKGYRLYAGSPLSSMSSSNRGALIEKIIRDYYEEHINLTENPSKDAKYCNGKYAYDFMDTCTRSRVEVKSSSLIWDKLRYSKRWRLIFQGVKPSMFDRLLLVGYFPNKLILWDWDGTTGLTSTGIHTSTDGYHISLSSYRDDVGTDTFTCKPGKILHEFCLFQLKTKYELLFVKSRKERMYMNSPIHTMNSSSRGYLLEEIAKSVWANSFGDVVQPKCSYEYSGQFPYDFHDVTSNIRVEVKSASFSVEQSNWAFRFQSVKISHFDKLILVFYFPDRLEMYVWDGRFGLSTVGKTTSSRGYTIYVPAKGTDLRIELTRTPGKLIFNRCFFESS